MTRTPDRSPAAIKAELRAAALARRAEMHARLGPSGDALVRHGAPLLERLPGRVVSAYLPIRDEIDSRPLIAWLVTHGRTVALPVIVERHGPLLFRRWAPGEPLAKAGFGLSVPLAEAPVVVPEILLVPLAGFDSAGYRLGYGGGYYDRTLARLRAGAGAVAIGLAYDEQLLPGVGREPHDQPLDWILTPSGATSFPDPAHAPALPR